MLQLPGLGHGVGDVAGAVGVEALDEAEQVAEGDDQLLETA